MTADSSGVVAEGPDGRSGSSFALIPSQTDRAQVYLNQQIPRCGDPPPEVTLTIRFDYQFTGDSEGCSIGAAVNRETTNLVTITDEGVTPGDIERAFDRAGLLDLVYRGPLGPFPTLRQMIDSGQRLVVMAENDAGDVPWYHLAYASGLQETPFRFRTAAALTEQSQLASSCRANRGQASAPLFLLNHWVDTTPAPRASLAEIVNARDVLLGRARKCERIRHRLPNLVAVDFFRRGDLLGVVDELNGVGR